MSQIELKKSRVTDPHKIFTEATKFITQKNPTILDVGAGYLNETRYLLERGYSVTAIDINPLPEELSNFNTTKLCYIQCDFHDYDFEQSSIDFLIAIHALFFVNPQNFNTFFLKLLDSIKPNGLFVGDVLGLHDSWLLDGKRPMTFMTKENILELLRESTQTFEVISLKDREWDGIQYDGKVKHWHTIEFIVKRK